MGICLLLGVHLRGELCAVLRKLFAITSLFGVAFRKKAWRFAPRHGNLYLLCVSLRRGFLRCLAQAVCHRRHFVVSPLKIAWPVAACNGNWHLAWCAFLRNDLCAVFLQAVCHPVIFRCRVWKKAWHVATRHNNLHLALCFSAK